jgi:hypothetical protein
VILPGAHTSNKASSDTPRETHHQLVTPSECVGGIVCLEEKDGVCDFSAGLEADAVLGLCVREREGETERRGEQRYGRGE